MVFFAIINAFASVFFLRTIFGTIGVAFIAIVWSFWRLTLLVLVLSPAQRVLFLVIKEFWVGIDDLVDSGDDLVLNLLINGAFRLARLVLRTLIVGLEAFGGLSLVVSGAFFGH